MTRCQIVHRDGQLESQSLAQVAVDRGEELFASGDSQAALAEFQRALAVSPGYAPAFNNIAERHDMKTK